MSGATEGVHGANNYDLLRRATQAMMSSRSAAADDDGTDQIGSDTPRSGVATPQPDLHDKRLPGIMSYFNQSGQSTPTRSLSTAHSQIEHAAPAAAGLGGDDSARDAQGRGDERSQSRAASITPTPQGAQAPAPKGKLTIKIVEARSLRRTKDPYVVAVFQRSELISGGPRPDDASDESAIAPGGFMGGIPIQRQASDSGRPPMAIPMRSRQSSNTSVTDYGAFRNRAGRRSLTNPKWDAEAVL